MPEQTYSQYFNIDKKYFAIVTKELIDEGKVKWDAFYPHDTFIQLLNQVVNMLTGKVNKSIWVEGSYGTGKSHATLALKSLLEVPEDEVRRYFHEYKLSEQLCNKFLSARSEKVNGKLIVIHKIGSSNIKNDDNLIWAIQDSVSRALIQNGIENLATGSMKDSLLEWINEDEVNKDYLNKKILKVPQDFNNMDLDEIIEKLQSDDEKTIEILMDRLIKLLRKHHMTAMEMDPERLAAWIVEIIEKYHLGAIVFIWDEFSEYFKNCQNSLTGFQTITQLSFNHPFYFVIVTHESDGLIVNQDDRQKLSDRFNERVKLDLPDNMAFRLMKQAMKETSDPKLKAEWAENKQALNYRLSAVREYITKSAKKHARTGNSTVPTDEDMMAVVPLHPYAALMLKHISRLFSSSQRSMFDFIIANDPSAEDNEDTDTNTLSCHAFKWYINHYGVNSTDCFMTVDMLWDFFTVKANGNMNPEALNILNNFDILTSEYSLNPDEQKVLRTVLLMNAICTRAKEADVLEPTYENIELAFDGTSWPKDKAKKIASSLVHREPPLQPVLFEQPMQDGTMRVIPKATSGVDITQIKNEIRKNLTTKELVEKADFASKISIPVNLNCHFSLIMLYTNVSSKSTFQVGLSDAKKEAQSKPGHFLVCMLLAMTDEERTEAGKMIQETLQTELPDNLLLLDATTNTFESYLENYVTFRAYSEYYLESDKTQANQFSINAKQNLLSWRDHVYDGEFRLYDATNKNGQMRIGFPEIAQLLQDFDRSMYPYGIEQYDVKPSMFDRNYMGQDAECGLTQTEKGNLSSNNPLLSKSALKYAWKVKGEYWCVTANQHLPIVQLKRKVEEVIHNAFDKNQPVEVRQIVSALAERPFGLTPSNLSAFILGFLLKEYANENYFWSNGTTRPMTVDLMKSAIKNALDDMVAPKKNYRPECIVTMSDNLRVFLEGTSAIFHENPEQCGSVDAAGRIIRLGMKRLDFPIWVLKSILPNENLQTDASIVADVIEKYLGIANIKNYPEKITESELAEDIGRYMSKLPNLKTELRNLFTSQKCLEGLKAYLKEYRGGLLPALAVEIKDNGNYISVLKKKFNADEANWVWSKDTANTKIDETITEYQIIEVSNTINAPSSKLSECVRNWKERIDNFRISLDAMELEDDELKELLKILYEIRQSIDNTIPETKKKTFLDLLLKKKDDFLRLYNQQEEHFKHIARSWLGELSDENIHEIYCNQLDNGVFCVSSQQFFNSVEEKVNAYTDAMRSKQLSKLWQEKTGTKTANPAEWSREFKTPILCMFNDSERQYAKEMCKILNDKIAKHTDDEYTKVEHWLQSGDFYERLAQESERDLCMKKRVIRDYSFLLPDVNMVREYLQDKLPSISVYDWMDNSTVESKIRELADKHYKMSGAPEAEKAVSSMSDEDLREYLKSLIKSDMNVGIAILKKQSKE